MNRLFNYISQSKTELTKVVWPSRRQGARLTFAVVVFSIAMATFIGLIDVAFTKVLQSIILKG